MGKTDPEEVDAAAGLRGKPVQRLSHKVDDPVDGTDRLIGDRHQSLASPLDQARHHRMTARQEPIAAHNKRHPVVTDEPAEAAAPLCFGEQPGRKPRFAGPRGAADQHAPLADHDGGCVYVLPESSPLIPRPSATRR